MTPSEDLDTVSQDAVSFNKVHQGSGRTYKLKPPVCANYCKLPVAFFTHLKWYTGKILSDRKIGTIVDLTNHSKS
jgi:hypothetical protein